MSFIWAVMIKLCIIIAARAPPRSAPAGRPLRRLNQRQQRPGVRYHQQLATATGATQPSGFTADALRQFAQDSPDRAGRYSGDTGDGHDAAISGASRFRCRKSRRPRSSRCGDSDAQRSLMGFERSSAQDMRSTLS
jgi:hypothetical protein